MGEKLFEFETIQAEYDKEKATLEALDKRFEVSVLNRTQSCITLEFVSTGTYHLRILTNPKVSLCVTIGSRGGVQAGDGGEAHRRRAARGRREGAPADDRGRHAHPGGVPRVQGAQGASKEAQERQEEEGRSGSVSRDRG